MAIGPGEAIGPVAKAAAGAPPTNGHAVQGAPQKGAQHHAPAAKAAGPHRSPVPGDVAAPPSRPSAAEAAVLVHGSAPVPHDAAVPTGPKSVPIGAVRPNGMPFLRDAFVVGAPTPPPFADWDEGAPARPFEATPYGRAADVVPAARLPESIARTQRPKEIRPGAPRAQRPPDQRRFGRDLYAALDLGTNNCRLLIAEPQRAGFRVVDAFSRIVRLGEGISASRRLSDAAQDRAVEALKVCKAKLDLRGVSRARLVATEACRVAENGESFLDRVEQEAGLKLEIVSRETEARLAVAGCASLVDWQSDGVILFDIGGGSSELVWLDLDRKSGQGDLTRHIRAWTSLPVGVVTLSERHGGVVVDRDVFEDMVDHVDALLDALSDQAELGEALASGRFHMLGTSGTVTTLAGVHLGLRRYDRRRVDGLWLADEDVSGLIDRLIDMDYAERVSNPCIGSDRADLVLAGCAILEAIRRRWPCERLRVADRGLREGILTELMVADGVWRRDGGRS